MHVLVLGGTAQARALAARLAGRGVRVTTSLAGRVTAPATPAGELRVGGFGGADGLAAYLAGHAVTAVVDATHPFAAGITRNAVRACTAAGLPLVVVRRPGWTPAPGDRWERVPSVADAARSVRSRPAGEPVLLTVGRGDLARFADDAHRPYVVRSIEAPQPGTLPPRHVVVLARPPFTVDGERSLLTAHGIGVLVTKDGGADAVAAKLVAARDLGVDVVMVDRPPLPPGVPAVESVDAALSALGLP